jgi:hypothetical protein
MGDIVLQSQYNTKARSFIAKQGALVMKEFSHIGLILGEHRSKVSVETLVFSIMQGGQIDRTYGLKITVTIDDNEYLKEDTCLIDQDELAELVNGIEYLEAKLEQLSNGVPNYTELSYVTRDDFKVGFYVNAGSNPDPMCFCSSGGPDSAFMKTNKLLRLKQQISKGRVYLDEVSATSRPESD